MKQRIWQISLLAVAIAAIFGFLPSQAAAVWGLGHFYVIGTGPAGPKTATLQALETMKKMDFIMADADHIKAFNEYIGDKKILFDPWTGFWDLKGKSYTELNEEEHAQFRVERFKVRDERVAKIKSLLAQGKDVGLLDSGNPCLFGPSHWYVEKFAPEEIVIIPGMGCDAAAMAALGKSTIPAYKTRFVMQTAPMFLFQDEDMENIQILKDLANYQTTMILYMALANPEKLFTTLGKVLPGDMPCAVVFWAGNPDLERTVRGTISDMGQKLAKEKEKFMGLLFIGKFLEGEPYDAAIKHQ